MKKNLLSLFVLLLSFSLFAQVGNLNNVADVATETDEKVILPYSSVPHEGGENVLFDNGPIISLPGGGCNGGDASILDGNTGGHTLFGWGFQQNSGNYMADDFTNTAAWNIDSMKFFAYQTGATAMTITGAYVQIWSGAPNAGGQVVWGDLTTNRLAVARLSTSYRAQNTTPTDCARRIQEIVANVSVNLPPGQYWVQFGVTGSAASGPWCPPVTIPNVAVTGDALQFTTAGGWAPALNGTTSPNGAPFIVYGTAGAPCPVEPPTYTAPANGAANVPISGNTASWTNGSGTTAVEVWFGTVGDLAQVYNGAPITSLNIPQLNYNTQYAWRVVNKNDTCGANGPTWTFTTMEDPDIVTLFIDDFETGLTNWTITNDPGNSPNAGWMIDNPPYPGAYTLPATAGGGVLAANTDKLGSGSTMPLSIARTTQPIDASIYQAVELSFDNDWRHLGTGEAHVEVSIDGGTTWTSVWSKVAVSLRNTTELMMISNVAALQSFHLRFRSVQPGWHWWWVVDNVKVRGYDAIPVELVSFTSNVIGNNISLSWATATETNNSGFEVQRKAAGSDFASLGFVVGNGTTAEIQYYSYSDQGVIPGTYEYRLKQIDYDGTFEYSSVIEVEVGLPQTFVLEQNFPNPFNPATSIKFALPLDADVNLSIYSVPGEHIATLTNGAMTAGVHTVSFDASSLTSGVYFYRIDANGVDGTNFSSVKKMILTK